MDSFDEVLVVSDAAQNNISCSIHCFKTLNTLTTYKGGSCPRNGLAFVSEDYIIAALEKKPILKVWTLCERPQDTSMPCPGVVTCLAVTNCGSYCIAGIENNIHIWEISNGVLLTKLAQFHSKTITCLRISSDGSHFISGGNDGMVFTWLLSGAIEENESASCVVPRFSWVDHSAAITDIYIGDISCFTQVATASKDMSCIIYELATGLKLATIRVDYAITALTRDKLDLFLILGSVEGDIFRVTLSSDENAEFHYDKTDTKFAFLGHRKEITCLSMSLSGKFLVSGSEDKECRVWDMSNFSCVRKISCAGMVTNVCVMLIPPGLNKDQRFYPQLNFATFKRHVEVQDYNTAMVTTRIQPNKLSIFHLGSPDDYFNSQILRNWPESTNPGNKPTANEQLFLDVNAQLYAYVLGDKTLSIKSNEKSNSSLEVDGNVV